MKRFLLGIFLCVFSLFSEAEINYVCVDNLRNADLLFVVNTKGNAITEVTEGLDHLPIDHVAIFYSDSASLEPMILQADYKGVRCCNLYSFWNESSVDTTVTANNSFSHPCVNDSLSPIILVGRIQVPFDLSSSLQKAFSFVGKKYDFYYLPDDDEIYCSELVQISFVDNQGKLLFSTIPMTFRDNQGEIPEFWVKHYAKKGIPIPEGEPGSNPGELSRRHQVKIIGRLTLCCKH